MIHPDMEILLHLLLYVHALDVPFRVGSLRVIDVVCFRLGHVDIHPADGIHQLDERPDVDADVFCHVQLEALADLARHQRGAAVTEGMRQPVILSLILPVEDRHAACPLKAHQMNLFSLLIDGEKNTGVASRIFVKLLGAVITSDEKNVIDITVGENIALRLNCLCLRDVRCLLLERLVLNGVVLLFLRRHLCRLIDLAVTDLHQTVL